MTNFRTPSPGAVRRLGAARQALLAAVISNTLSVLPVFLLGALAVMVRRDLEFSEFRLGLAVAAFSGVSALTSVMGGRLSERIGAVRAMSVGAVGSAVTLLGIAVFARSWAVLVAFLALGGIAGAIAQPGTNLAVARAISEARQGFAYGIKQASVPLATITSGLAVPTVALTVGWRWAFAAGALGALLFAIVTPRPSGRPAPRAKSRRSTGDTATKPLVILAVAVAFAAAAANSLSAFYVESAVANGLSPGVAGLWLVAGGLAGVAARMTWGWLADRRSGHHLPVVASLMVGGAAGFALLGFFPGALALGVGTVLAFAAGWGWPGLFNFAVVRHNRGAPAAATGITQTGVYVGALTGPPTFGFLVENASYGVAWGAAAGALVVAGALVIVGRRSLIADLNRRRTD